MKQTIQKRPATGRKAVSFPWMICFSLGRSVEGDELVPFEYARGGLQNCDSLWAAPPLREAQRQLLHTASGSRQYVSRGFFKALSDRLKGVPPPVYSTRARD